MAESPQKIIDRIRKLLALASSNNEHEAAAAAAAAQRLLSEHNLSMSEVDIREEARSARTITCKSSRRPPFWVKQLASSVANAFDCRLFHSHATEKFLFLGVGADPDVATFIFAYLERTLRTLTSKFMKKYPSRFPRRAHIRDAYLRGAILVIHMRLQLEKECSPITPGAMVPVKEAAIDRACAKWDILEEKKPRKKEQREESEAESLSFILGMRAGEGIPIRKGISEMSVERQ